MMQMKIEEALKEQGLFVSTISGNSMYPMLRDRKDIVMICPCEGRLSKYDVALYRAGGRYILHRVIKVLPDSYVICGDNCINREYGITDKQILGVLTGFCRNGKEIKLHSAGYQIYIRMWYVSDPVRYLYRKFRKAASKMKHAVRDDKGEGK